MDVRLIMEYNDIGVLLYTEQPVGAFMRGRTEAEALSKLDGELRQYALWSGEPLNAPFTPEIVQRKQRSLHIEDADSDVLFNAEKAPLSPTEYSRLKQLVLRSAQDFQALYDSIPVKDASPYPPRETFYGAVPRTAAEMYAHTKNVNAYYFGEIGVTVGNEPTIAECRALGFALLERQADLLDNPVFDGSYGEQWTLRKVMRRFVWHDRIHAKAMYRMACRLCGQDAVANPFSFER